MQAPPPSITGSDVAPRHARGVTGVRCPASAARAFAPGSRPVIAALCTLPALVASVTAVEIRAEPAVARGAENETAVEEMIVVGEARPAMDVLAGATTTRIEADRGLIEGAQIDDLLAEVPGVQVRRFGGVGERFEISIRGSTPEQVPVFLDGVRLDSSLTGRSDLSTICLDVLDEIQVTRGAGAARAGSGAIGGVVNLVSRPAPEIAETRVRASAGNFGAYEGSVRHARRLEKWDLALAYCGFHTDGDFEYQRQRNNVGGGGSPIVTRDNNESDRHTALFQAAHPVGAGRLGLSHLTSHLDRGNPGLESDPRLRAQEKNLSTLTTLRFDHPVVARFDGEFGALVSHRFERNDFEDPEAVPGRIEPIDIETALHSFTARTTSAMTLAPRDGFGRHRFSLLAEGRLDRRGSNESNAKSRAGIALRAELTSSFFERRLEVSPSLRFERYSGLDAEWIPGLFLKGRPWPWLDLKASASRSYRIPSFQELYLPDKGFERGNEDLDPEKAWNFEVGAVLRSPFESNWLDGDFEATYFAGEVDDSIAFTLISPNVIAPVNVGPSTTRGYELTLRWRPRTWLRMTAARTVTRARLDETNRNVVGIAVSQIDGRIELGPRDRFKLVGEVHYTGRIPLNPGGTAEQASRVSFDASASVDLAQLPGLRLDRYARSLWLSVRGRNLGNSAIRDARARPRPGRNFSVALEGRF